MHVDSRGSLLAHWVEFLQFSGLDKAGVRAGWGPQGLQGAAGTTGARRGGGYKENTCQESQGNSLAVQWLELHASTAGDTGLIPGWGTKILQAMRPPSLPPKKEPRNKGQAQGLGVWV